MKAYLGKLLTFISVLMLATSAQADTCSAALTGVFTAAQATKLCAGSLVSSTLTFSSTPGSIKGAGTIIISPVSDPNRLVSFAASSDTNQTITFGDGGTTASQNLKITASTADADDDSKIFIAGGGSNGVTRGGTIIVSGNEETASGTVGYIELYPGSVANSRLDLGISVASGLIRMKNSSGNTMWTVNDSGVLFNTASNGGDVSLGATGTTLSVQEGTAASACMGTVTFNGTTAVTKSTTCAITGSRIFLTPTSDPTGSTAAYCWATNIVNGVSFDVDCDQANDGTANWIIFHEAA
jgi:hypothetical protein